MCTLAARIACSIWNSAGRLRASTGGTGIAARDWPTSASQLLTLDAGQEEVEPDFPIAFGSHAVQEIVVSLPVTLEVEAQVQDRFHEHAGSAQLERDQQPAARLAARVATAISLLVAGEDERAECRIILLRSVGLPKLAPDDSITLDGNTGLQRPAPRRAAAAPKQPRSPV